jgi:hypothetical protein
MKAFPTTENLIDGMDLRDYFAAQVISYLAKDYKKEMQKSGAFDDWGDEFEDDKLVPNYDSKRIAQYAYAIADSMMEIRKV